MTAGKCFFCDRVVATPVHLTEVSGGVVETCDMCLKCGEIYMNDLDKTKPDKAVDLSHIKTPEQLLRLLEGETTPCECGMTEDAFDRDGRFGCPECYRHFKEKMESLVFPFHGARSHVGKKPKVHYLDALMRDPVEREKILKLRYAKALELENYEQAAEIKRQLTAPYAGETSSSSLAGSIIPNPS